MDTTRKLASVMFEDVAVNSLGTVSEASLESIWDYISIALAHEMIGGAQHLLDTTVDYTKLRYQFGRPIGSFQGLKHRLAGLLINRCDGAAIALNNLWKRHLPHLCGMPLIF